MEEGGWRLRKHVVFGETEDVADATKYFKTGHEKTGSVVSWKTCQIFISHGMHGPHQAVGEAVG